MIKITIEGDTVAEVGTAIVNMAKQFQTTPAPAATASSPKAPAAPKEPAAPKAAAPKAAAPKEISYADDVAPRVLKLAEVKGRDAAVAVLSTFGVSKAPQLTADQYPEVIAALDAALAED